jgi:hypothetical protein
MAVALRYNNVLAVRFLLAAVVVMATGFEVFPFTAALVDKAMQALPPAVAAALVHQPT